jgi:hypothetical protein
MRDPIIQIDTTRYCEHWYELIDPESLLIKKFSFFFSKIDRVSGLVGPGVSLSYPVFLTEELTECSSLRPPTTYANNG